jgi:exonuclease SbcC
MERELKVMEGESEKSAGILEGLEKEFSLKNEEYQKSLGILKEREESIPENIRTASALIQEMAAVQREYDRLADELKRAKNEFDDAGRLLTQARTSFEDGERALKEAEEKYASEKAAFAESMKKAGFEKYEDYDLSKMDETATTLLVRDIKTFGNRLKSSEDAYNRALKLSEGIVFENLETFEAALRKAEEERDTALKEESGLTGRIKIEKELLRDIMKLDEEISRGNRDYSILGKLSEVSNGSNDYGIDFQRFVLGVLLDDITIAATERLKLMSRGRYHLNRTLDRARKNAAGGLELEVFDTYTGIERPVTTLSGGESFLASLSLALGLADVVQSYSGGISLDTIFVDEGFGTLDPESLDFAVNTLIDLQKGGRLVGIISHVPELKERMDARLEVTPVEKGSIACFKVS